MKITTTVRMLALCSVAAASLLAAPALFAQDRLTIDTVTVQPGQTNATVPVRITDTSGTPLGMDKPAGAKLQAFSFQVTYSPSAAVSSVTIVRAGITAALTPVFETTPGGSGTISYLVTYDETSAPLAFTGGADVVANLNFVLSAGAVGGTTISLTINPSPAQTGFSNQAGTISETVGAGLVLTDGSIVVASPTFTLTPDPESIPLGGTAPFTVTSSTAVPTAALITLTSADSATVSVPASVTIPAGGTTATFNATGVAIGGPITITATPPAIYGSAGDTAQVTVTGVELEITPATQAVTFGTNATMTATISPVQSSSTTVTLSSNNTTTASVPATVTIPASTASVSIPVTTGSVGSATITGTLPVGLGATTDSAVISVSSITFSITPTSQNVVAGSSATLTATLGAARTTSTTVTLSSTDPLIAAPPASVTIAANQISASFQVPTIGVGSAGVVGTLPASLGSGTAIATINTTAPGFTLTPSTATVPGGGTTNLTASLSVTAGAPVTVNLSSANPAVASVPASVTIPAGSTSVAVPVTGVAVGGPVTITATLTQAMGQASDTSDVTVTGRTITLTPFSTTIGVGTNGSLTASVSPTSSTPTTITLASANPGIVSVAGSVSLPAGASSVAVPISGVAVGGPVGVTATLPAAAGGGSSTSQVTVTSLSIFWEPPSMTLPVGASSSLRVVVTSPVASATTIALSYSGTAVSGPGAVTINAGESSALVAITANSVGSASITAYLPAGLGGGSASVSISVVPLTLAFIPGSLHTVVGGTASFQALLSGTVPYVVAVSITSSDPTVASAPSQLIFPANTTLMELTVTGNKVGGPVAITGTLPSSFGGSSTSADVTVTSGIALTFTPTSATIPAGGFTTVTAKIGAPQGESVRIDLSGGDGSIVSVPSFVDIPAGSTSASFRVNALAAGGPVSIVGTMPAPLGGSNASVAVTVTEAIHITLSPATLDLDAGRTGSLTATISRAWTSDITLLVFSSDPGVAAVSGTVTIPAGSTTAALAVSAYSQGTTTILASLPAGIGGSSASSIVRVSGITDGSLSPQLMVPGLARAAGSNGSFFRSSMWLTNPGSGELKLRLRYVPGAGQSAGGARNSVELSLAPRRSLAFADLLAQAFFAGSDTAGVVTVESANGSPLPVVTSRTYNDAGDDGTYGQFIPPVRLGAAATAERWLTGLAEDGGSRTNVGVVNRTDSPITATLVVFAADGTRRGNDVVVEVPGRSSAQVNRIAQQAGAGSLSLFSVRVRATGSFAAYASKLDNLTSDPVFVPGDLQSRSEQWIDGIARAAGDAGTFFRSSLSVANLGSAGASVTVDFTPRGGTSSTASRSFDVAGGRSVFHADVLSDLLGLTDGVGMIRIRSSAPVQAWARTYNDATTGTYGQFIPAFGADALAGAGGSWLHGISENADFRTNAGLVNVSGSSVTATVALWKSGGSKVAEKVYTVAAGQAVFVRKIANDLGVFELADGYLVVTPSAVSALYAWTSTIDNVSSDQTFATPYVLP